MNNLIEKHIKMGLDENKQIFWEVIIKKNKKEIDKLTAYSMEELTEKINEWEKENEF